MPIRLFVDTPLHAGAEIDLPAGAARHAQVRRVQPGGTLVLFDGGGADWPAEVLAMGRSRVAVRVGDARPLDNELACAVTLAVGMPANERMDTLVEKAAELGATALQPLLCERSVLRLSGERAQRKCEHWQAVAVAACEQSGRARLLRIDPVRTLAQWLADGVAQPQRLLLSPQPQAVPLARLALDDAPLCALSGPEGGLSPAEEQAALAAGFVATGLGPRVLRADTAPLALLAALGLRR